MISYEKLKEKLEQEGKSCSRYFTRKVYETYLEEKQKSLEYFEKTGQWLPLVKSESTDFYQKNGYGWCRMLEIVYAELKKWRIEFYDNYFPYDKLVEIRYMHFDTKAEVNSWAKAYKPGFLYNIEEVED